MNCFFRRSMVVSNLKAILFTLLFIFSTHLFAQKSDAPKLVVGIVVDQMCYDYLYRFYPNFSKNGLRKLMDQGTNVRNLTYNYVPTYTGPGHASIYTGATPSNHGIVANDWYSTELNSEVYCVYDSTVFSVGTTSQDGMSSPHFLRANTITDQLKLTYPKAKVIAVSIKDRSAVLPAGHIADGAYWYDYTSGNFVTSSFYNKTLPEWIEKFRISNPIDAYLNTPWNLSIDSSKYQWIDNQAYEVDVFQRGNTNFPYSLDTFSREEKIEYFTMMPAANTYLTDFAMNATSAENLGKDNITDFLAISYSTPDIAGHSFGPYSREIEDIYYKLDAEISRLLTYLNKNIGKNQYTLFLTADHAVVPVPQMLKDLDLPGGYLYKSKRFSALMDSCVRKFGFDPIAEITNNNVYLSEETKNHPDNKNIIDFIKMQILSWEEIKEVYTEEELKKAPANSESKMIQAGFESKRSGELIFSMHPGYLTKTSESAGTGTSHGTAYNYDTHVPLLFYGKNIHKMEVFTPYEITDISATLVHILNVQRPNAMTGKPIIEILNR